MIKKMILPLGLLGLCWASVLLACGGAGTGLLNGFESASSACSNAGDFSNWAFTKGPACSLYTFDSGAFASGGSFLSPDPNNYGWMTFTAACETLSLTTFNAPVGANWSNYRALRLAVVSTDMSQMTMSLDFQLGSGAGTTYFTGFVLASITAATIGSSDWSHAVICLNYAKNMGMDLTSMQYLSITPYITGLVNNVVEMDELMVDNTTGSIYNPIPAGSIFMTVTTTCNTMIINWPTGTDSGDPIAGYHIYRAVAPGGPYTSVGFVMGKASTSYSDPAAPQGSYYQVLPFASSVTVSASAVTHSQVMYIPDGFNPGVGVVEAKLAAAGAGPFSPKLPTAVPVPFSLSGIGCTSEINLNWGDVKGSLSGCNTFNTYNLQRSQVFDFTSGVSNFFTTSSDYSDMSVVANQFYYYRVRVQDSLGTNGAWSGITNPSVLAGPPGAPCATPGVPSNQPSATPTVTVTQTYTPQPAPTVNVDSGAYVYPNPFSPLKGELFRVGNVPPDSEMFIFNMVGEQVYYRKLAGDYKKDYWDGINANGIKVVTGVYFCVIKTSSSATVHKVAVIRE